MEIKYCGCGSPMSNYDIKHYTRCGGCRAEEESSKRAERARAEEQRKEDERMSALKKEEERQAQLKVAKEELNANLKVLAGKTISEAVITEWTDAGGLEASSVRVRLTDGTYVDFTNETYVWGRWGDQEKYPYLAIEIND